MNHWWEVTKVEEKYVSWKQSSQDWLSERKSASHEWNISTSTFSSAVFFPETDSDRVGQWGIHPHHKLKLISLPIPTELEIVSFEVRKFPAMQACMVGICNIYFEQPANERLIHRRWKRRQGRRAIASILSRRLRWPRVSMEIHGILLDLYFPVVIFAGETIDMQRKKRRMATFCSFYTWCWR